jgi:predicted alpha-1,6-mannanase (GH76 family)
LAVGFAESRGWEKMIMIPRCRKCVAVFLFMLYGSLACNAASRSERYLRHAALATGTLQAWYDENTGLYQTTGWWNSANAITVLADYERVARVHQYDSVFANTLVAAQRKAPGFLNNFYDDEGWWALAWIDVYDLTGDRRYLMAAQSIFADMSEGWDETCSGGIWWSKDRKYKNAIANELFLSVAAHLANRADSQGREHYLEWAQKEWEWFLHSSMINANHLVNDGLTAGCLNNGQATWSYNQGVILGGLAELYKANHDSALLAQAHAIASAAIKGLRDAHGVLHDSCEPNCGGDGTQFKGIFVRNLSALDAGAPQLQYEKFIFANADSLWSGAHPPSYLLGEVWAAPFGKANASTQSSALDALVSAAEIVRRSQR